MAWRFAASKFKNTTPKLPKKENIAEEDGLDVYSSKEPIHQLVTCKLKITTDTIFDVPVGNLSCTNNGIQASADFLAFHIEGEGGKLGVLPAGVKGRRTRNDIWIVAAHGEQVSDFTFMTYADDYLATCSRDEAVKLWKLSRDSSPSLAAQIDVAAGVVVETMKSHSTASNILALGSYGSVFIADVSTQKIAIALDGVNDKTQSLDWSEDGRLLAVSGDKGRQVVVYDPRAGGQPIHSLEGHGGMGREARVLFAGDRLISTGFTNKRVQEVRVFDAQKWGAPIHTQEFVSTTGVLIPHYDPDTRLVFLSGKGTNKLFMMELQDRQPYMSSVFELTLPEQTLGAAIGSKRRVNVMDGEVDTYYQLTKSTIVPTPCIVPRRSYRDFHAELFPDTRGGEAGCDAYEWFSGNNSAPSKISLAPNTASPPPQEPTPPPQQHVAPKPMAVQSTNVPKVEEREKEKPKVQELDYRKYEKENGLSNVHTPNPPTSSTQGNSSPLTITSPDPITVIGAHSTLASSTDRASCSVSTPSAVGPSLIEKSKDDASTSNGTTAPVTFRKTIGASSRSHPLSQRVRPKSCVVGQITSKFRHVETLAGIKANNAVFSNLRNVNTRLPQETNGCCCSGKFVAVPLAGPAGIIGIYDVDSPGKLADGVMDGIYNKAAITDLQWNPFDDQQLAVGTDCGQINLWRLTTEDGTRSEMEPERVIKIGGEKIMCLRWHPLASNLMAVALSNSTIEVWDVKEAKLYHRFANHSGGILAIAWSAGGRRLASVGKDSMLYVHMPAEPESRICERKVLESTRAARVLFACDDRIVIVIGLTRSSQRQVQMYDATTTDLRPIYNQVIDSATQPLIPHYDYDTNVLFLSGKGDRIVNMFEVVYDSPYLLPLTAYMSPIGGQAIAFHNKKRCNVMAVEFQVGWRLNEKSLEHLIFRVPRIKKDVFQDDLFPDSIVTWEPVTTAAEWMSGVEATPIFRSLKPDGVYSSIPRPVASTQPVRHSEVPTTVSAAEKPTPIQRNPQSCAVESANTPPDLQQVAAAWSTKINVDTRLEQDRMEGVDESEWK